MSLSEDSWQKVDAVFDMLSDRFPDEESRVEVKDGIVYFHVGSNSLGVEIRAVEQGTKSTLLKIISEWRTAKWGDNDVRSIDEANPNPPALMAPEWEQPYERSYRGDGMFPYYYPSGSPRPIPHQPQNYRPLTEQEQENLRNMVRQPQIPPLGMWPHEKYAHEQQQEVRVWRDPGTGVKIRQIDDASELGWALAEMEAREKRLKKLAEKSMPIEPVPEEKSEGPSDKPDGDASKVDGRVAET